MAVGPVNKSARRAKANRAWHTYVTEVRHATWAWGIPWLVLLGILAVGGALRFYNLNWDTHQHLHPDERFLTQVETAIQLPASLGEYFDTATSPLNPYNRGFTSYVYGTFPLFLTRWVGHSLAMTGYDQIHLVGRAMSGVMDLISILFIFLIGRYVYEARVGLLAALLLAFSVFNIQQSHFFTVDMPANVLVVIAMYFAVRVATEGRWLDYGGLGLAFGLGVASKLNLALFGVIIVLAGALRLLSALPALSAPLPTATPPANPPRQRRRRALALPSVPPPVAPMLEPEVFLPTSPVAEARRHWWQTALAIGGGLAASLALAGVIFRIAQPYAFAGPGLFDIQLSSTWQKDMASISRTISGQVDYPASHQWAFRTPYLFPWLNIVQWGMGWALGLSGWAGLGLAAYQVVARRDVRHLPIVVWVLILFGSLGGGFVLTMRYFLPIYPFLALMAAYLLIWLWDRAQRRRAMRTSRSVYLAGGLLVGVVVYTVVWAIAFTEVYRQPVSRVTASRWIYDNVPKDATFGWEHWDDALPLRVDGKDAAFFYKSVELPLYAEDNREKLYGYPNQPQSGLLDKLDQVEWIFVSSGRLYTSIPRLPMRYPMTTRYYEALFSGELGFEHVKRFTVFPSILGREMNDQAAEEQFHVYDHPQVDIFRKTPSYARTKTESLLGATDWESVQRLTPLVAMRAPNGLLLSEAEGARQQAGGTWSAIFDRLALVNQSDLAALLAWLLAVELLSFAALPVAMFAFRNLPDRGYILAKPLGLLLVSYVAWLLASLTPLPYSQTTILVSLGLVAIVGGLLVAYSAESLTQFFYRYRRLIIVNEGLFLLCFLAFALLRMANPDLWRPWTGGEKPMDFAYLNAVIKSTSFPPYDPWFAGGTINYYYLGFVLIATLTKLTGIVPWVAYNLAIPVLFAMTATAAFSIVYNLTAQTASLPRRPVVLGVLGALCVAVLGNLGELKLILQGLSSLGGSGEVSSAAEFWQRAIAGLPLWLGGQELPLRTDWWYWNATRIMPHGEIHEFPFFTFLYGDLHAHMLALPITLLALTGALHFVRDADPVVHSLADFLTRYAIPLSVLGLAIGSLRAINTWDYPTYLMLGIAGLGIWGYHQRGFGSLAAGGYGMLVVVLILRFVFGFGPEISLVAGMCIGFVFGLLAGERAVLLSGILALMSHWLFLPYHRAYGQAYDSAELWTGPRTALADYLLIHGLFLFVLATFLILETVVWVQRAPVALASPAPGSATLGWTTITEWGNRYRNRIVLGLVVLSGGMGLGLSLLGVPIAILVLPLLALAVGLLLRPTPTATQRLSLVLIGVGLLMTLLVEVVVIKGDIGRANTVFKFYLQVWSLWGLATAVSLGGILDRLRSLGALYRRVWLGALGCLLLATALYPVFATRAHVGDRFDTSLPLTLNGMAFMQTAVYRDTDYAGKPVELKLEYDQAALTWMQDTIAGSPVIAEGNSGLLYHWTGRVSIWTGLPSLLGYNWHQKQQRSLVGGETVDQRERQANALYRTESTDEALALIRRFNIGYIYVGSVERALYPPAGLAKFEAMLDHSLDLAYQNPQVRIYRVRETAS